MLRCPNASTPGHPPADQGRFSASALVMVGPEWDVREVREFLGPEAVCCDCLAEATEVDE
jgi:hypothetical protein